MKFCMQCGTQASTDNQKFCKVCGNKFPEMQYENTQPTQINEAKRGSVISPHDFELQSGEATEYIGSYLAEQGEPTEYVAAMPDAGEATEYAADAPDADEATEYVGTCQDKPLGGFDANATAYDDDKTISESSFGDGVEATDNDKYFAWDAQQNEPNARQPSEDACEESVPAGDAEPIQLSGNEVQGSPKKADAKKAKKHAKKAKIAKSGSKKQLPVPIIIIIVLLILALLGVGGYFGWKYYKQSTIATIGGNTYIIDETTSISLSSPSAEDWEQLARLTRLKTVAITGSGSDVVTDEQISNLSALKQLAELSINGVKFEGTLDTALDAEELTALAITNCGLTDEQCASLPEMRGLETLDLSDNSLTSLSFLAQYPNITELDVSGNPITDCTGLAHVATLEELSIDQCSANELAVLSDLKKLKLGGENISNPTDYIDTLKNLTTQYETVIALIEAGDFSTISDVLQSMDYGSIDYEELQDIEYVNGNIMFADTNRKAIKATLASGTKILKFDTNGVYYGQMSDEERSGEGTQFFSNDDNITYYIGEWSNNLPNGAGAYTTHTWVDDGVLKLSYAGEYVNGYENGAITFTVEYDNEIGSDDPSETPNHSTSQYATAQTTTFNSANGTRDTIKQISDSQYAYAQFGNDYWYNSSPSGHGVIMNGIEYQYEEVVEIVPEPKTTTTTQKKTSSTPAASSVQTTVPAAAPDPTPAPADTSIQDIIDFGLGVLDWLYG